MKSIVFLGPTLPRAEAALLLDAHFAPPVEQGDVLRAARERPSAIGIVDGYFDLVPAVWHKEILWAMKEGIPVFGAASMGALRAAELSAFGMHGVGEIYAAFHSGELSDDDEVAVAHGDASEGYRMVSEAMVNIRATLNAATNLYVIDREVGEHLIGLAKEMFYPERSYARLLAVAREEGVAATQLEALAAFLPKGRVDRKRADARMMLEEMRLSELANEVCRPTFSFSYTEAWSQVEEWADSQPSLVYPAHVSSSLVATEVRLSANWQVIEAGFNRALAASLQRGRFSPSSEAGRSERARSFRGRVAHPGRDFDQWLDEHALSAGSFSSFMDRCDAHERARRECAEQLDVFIVDELRERGGYEGLAQRARHKQRVLAERGLAAAGIDACGVDRSSLLSWYWREVLKCPVPDDVEEFARRWGVETEAALEAEAVREFLYRKVADAFESAG